MTHDYMSENLALNCFGRLGGALRDPATTKNTVLALQNLCNQISITATLDEQRGCH